MGTGRLAAEEFSRIMAHTEGLKGDYAEIGVYRGDLFNRLAVRAHEEGRTAHAFDSFQGMAQPGPLDGDQYPAGVLNVGGTERFASLLTAPASSYRLWPGWIPQCFDGAEDLELAFCYIDVDHCEPTAQAIAWAWPRVVPGGVVGFDDYFPGRARLATPAIEDFLGSVSGFRSVRANENSQLFATKR